MIIGRELSLTNKDYQLLDEHEKTSKFVSGTNILRHSIPSYNCR